MPFRSDGFGTATGPKSHARHGPPSRHRESLTVPVVSKTTVRLYPPDVAIIDAWAAANPDPETGLTPSRPTAIRRMIRAVTIDNHDLPVSQRDLANAVEQIVTRLGT